jgi:phosphoserine phosphatase RsbU/P
MNTLIVENDFSSRRLLQKFLSPYGICDVATNGSEALWAFKAAWKEGQLYNLLCLDLMIPGMEDLEVQREIRNMEEEMGIRGGNRLKMILTGTSEGPPQKKEDWDPEREVYLTKPISKQKLLKEVANLGLLEPPKPMRILIAEDDNASRRILQLMLTKWGYDLVVTKDGNEAWQALQIPDAPRLAILDWMMPGKDGVEICRKMHESSSGDPKYFILLTSKGRKEDIVSGLEAGAYDYITKPFASEELRARVQAGERILRLQTTLANRVLELQEALDKIKTLEGILPICSYCKKIRNDQSYWQQLESYISQHSQAEFTHGVCPECFEKHIKQQIESLGSQGKGDLAKEEVGR